LVEKAAKLEASYLEDLTKSSNGRGTSTDVVVIVLVKHAKFLVAFLKLLRGELQRENDGGGGECMRFVNGHTNKSE